MRFNNIQILRFLAALGVVLYHSNVYLTQKCNVPVFSNFFDFHFSWGVQLFFVISGFVLSHTLTSTNSAHFLLYRAVRIYPPFWLLVILLIAVKLAVYGSYPWGTFPAMALSLLPVGNIAYPLGVEWSLVYEVFFYVVIAALGLLPWRLARDALAIVWLVAILVANHYQASAWTSFLPTLSTIGLSALNIPFIFGVLAYSWYSRGRPIPTTIWASAFPAALAAALWLPQYELLLLSAGFTCLVLAAAQLSRRRDLPSSNILVRMGDYSYGLYLIHVPVITILLSRLQPRAEHAETAFAALVLAALLFGSTYGAIEMRLHRVLKRATARRLGDR